MTKPERINVLVAYDYGMGGLWGVMAAASTDQVREIYPELAIVDERPSWMTEERFLELVADPYDIDDEPRGLVKVLLAERARP